jgi:hypothetical protein
MTLEYLLREQDILFLILTMNKFCKALNDVRTQSRLSLWQLIDELEISAAPFGHQQARSRTAINAAPINSARSLRRCRVVGQTLSC